MPRATTKPRSALARQKYRLVPFDAVKLHPKNRRAGDVASIVESIKVNGWIGAGYTQTSTGFLIVGNHRYQAFGEARGLIDQARADPTDEAMADWLAWPDRFGELDVFPVIDVDVDDETAERYLIADNATSDRATWVIEGLAADLVAINERQGSLIGTAYDEVSLNALLTTVAYHAQGRPTLAEMQGRHPDVDETALWPAIRMQIPPDVYARFGALMGGFGDGPEAERFAMLIDAAERGLGA